MRNILVLFPLILCLALPVSALAEDTQPPDAVVEKMAFKLVRGVTNVVTCIAELPKQTYLTVRDQGAVGYLIGPLKGVGMTIYRGVIGGIETVFFMVPQPGYYDSMVNPDYVWNGMEEKRIQSLPAQKEQ
jgi:putative exosortase-associated protein (TIGR04073 family)